MSNIIPFPVIQDVEITTDSKGRFSLNALHRASEADDHKKPSQWLRTKQASELIDELEKLRGISRLDQIVSNKGGKTPGTFAHELLAISYAGWISPAFQLRVNQVFLDYRTGNLQPQTVPQSLPEALRLAAELAEEKERLSHQVEEMKPDVEITERIAKAHGNLCITDAAKVLKINPYKLRDWLDANKWIYDRGSSSNKKRWKAYQVKLDQDLLAHRVTPYFNKMTGDEVLSYQVLITPKGLTKLAGLLNQDEAA